MKAGRRKGKSKKEDFERETKLLRVLHPKLSGATIEILTEPIRCALVLFPLAKC